MKNSINTHTHIRRRKCTFCTITNKNVYKHTYFQTHTHTHTESHTHTHTTTLRVTHTHTLNVRLLSRLRLLIRHRSLGRSVCISFLWNVVISFYQNETTNQTNPSTPTHTNCIHTHTHTHTHTLHLLHAAFQSDATEDVFRKPSGVPGGCFTVNALQNVVTPLRQQRRVTGQDGWVRRLTPRTCPTPNLLRLPSHFPEIYFSFQK